MIFSPILCHHHVTRCGKNRVKSGVTATMSVNRKFFDINDKRTRENPRVTKKTPLNYDGIVEVRSSDPA
jgi:hypothetical protein